MGLHREHPGCVVGPMTWRGGCRPLDSMSSSPRLRWAPAVRGGRGGGGLERLGYRKEHSGSRSSSRQPPDGAPSGDHRFARSGRWLRMRSTRRRLVACAQSERLARCPSLGRARRAFNRWPDAPSRAPESGWGPREQFLRSFNEPNSSRAFETFANSVRSSNKFER